MTERQDLYQQRREVLAEMKRKGIRRISCMNGGHSPDSYRLNAEMFRLETQLKRIPKP